MDTSVLQPSTQTTCRLNDYIPLGMQVFKFASALLFIVTFMSAQSAARPGCVDVHGGNPDDVAVGMFRRPVKLSCLRSVGGRGSSFKAWGSSSARIPKSPYCELSKGVLNV